MRLVVQRLLRRLIQLGDIVLLSQLTYNLYSTVSSASSELRDLENVLYSLKCAFDHLGSLAGEIEAKVTTNGDPKGLKLHENLGQILGSCASTLKELDKRMKKYREAGLVDEEVSKSGKRKWDQKLKMNWMKLKWVEEKETWAEYQEKLRVHSDAINLILNSVILSQTNRAASASRAGHEETQKLLKRVVDNPETDATLLKMIREIHQAINGAPGLPAAAPAGPTLGGSSIAYSVAAASTHNASTAKAHMQRAILTQATEVGFSVSISRPGNVPGKPLPSPEKIPGGPGPQQRDLPPVVLKAKPVLSSALINLNNERRAYAIREFDEFAKNHRKQAKPFFLAVSTPSAKQLKDDLSYIFTRPKDRKKEPTVLQIQQWTSEMSTWIQSLENCVEASAQSGDSGPDLIELLVALNHAIDQSDENTRALFYEAADHMELPNVLDQLHNKSKSVRILKELEEFEDARDDWNEGRTQ